MSANADIRVLCGAEDFGLEEAILCALQEWRVSEFSSIRCAPNELVLSGRSRPLLHQAKRHYCAAYSGFSFFRRLPLACRRWRASHHHRNVCLILTR